MEKQTFFSAIQQICEEKGISKERVLETIEMALAAAYKKDFGEKGQIIRAKMDPETGETKMFQIKMVVDESMIKSEEEIAEEIERRGQDSDDFEDAEEIDGVRKVRFNEEKHIMLADAQAINVELKVGDELITPLETHEEFGRIAAQTAKQVILQRIKEAERETIYDEYKAKEYSLISGIIQRIERGVVIVDIGKINGFLYPEEQIIGEYYNIGQRLRFLVLEVRKEIRGPQIVLSRTHPKLVSKLFELEVPEIASGTVEIKAVAREAGSRTKIAVVSNMEGLDPIGSCVGQKGTRVQAVINELGGEKIDIIEWNRDFAKYIVNALSPAKIINIEVDERRGFAKAFVPAEQLSLAIGKRGQNVRLAVKLVGWKIDIISYETGEKLPVETEKELKQEVDNLGQDLEKNDEECKEKCEECAIEECLEEKEKKDVEGVISGEEPKAEKKKDNEKPSEKKVALEKKVAKVKKVITLRATTRRAEKEKVEKKKKDKKENKSS